ncbi:hypothetical protein BBJ28_00006970 [Nothophytophthora sp. Chile5]|nr:hypothetical protein BBJ28_00006970 [Nothophytophthora sp. Chile5]
MCGANDAVCLHGVCVVEAVGKTTFECCQCDALYSGSQCSSRDAMAYFEAPLACASILVLLVVGVFLTNKAIALLRFSEDENDEFDFPREWEASLESSLSARLLRGEWSGPTQKGLPWKPAKHHLTENTLITLVVLLDLVQWVQLTALSFLPVVPWPASSRGIAKLLRLALLYPLWSHLEASHFPTTMLYLALGFVPGVLIVACVLGAKRFPLFKPQPKSSPAEDLCTVMLRLHSEWLVLPVMIGLLLPLECVFIGYTKDEGSDMVLPTMDASCFSLLQGAQIAAGVCMLLVFWFVSCAIVVQLNCEASPPTPTLWTHVQYMRVTQVLKAPLAMV